MSNPTFSDLNGKLIAYIIPSDYAITIRIDGGDTYTIFLDDEGEERNSHALFKNTESLHSVKKKRVVSAIDNKIDKDNCEFTITFDDGSKVSFKSVHQHKGDCVYSYDVCFLPYIKSN